MNNQNTNTSFIVSRDMAFWQGLDVHDTASIDRVSSARFVSEEAIPVPEFDQWVVQGEPLLWQNRRQSEALINQQYFSALQVVDLTSLDAPAIIGQVRPDLMQIWQYKTINRFLLTTSILQTFIHSHAELQLIKRDEGDVFSESYNASHFYYTNEEIRVDYQFRVAIDRQSGTIEASPL